MSTLPTLPTCGDPATVRIELYTPGSLDACAYTCAAHTVRASAAVARAGLAAHVTGMAPDMKRSCGDVFVYPTGALGGAPADLTHPHWCNRDDCERRGRHRSRILRSDTNRPEAFIVGVALVQALHPAAKPTVRLTSVEGGAATSLVLSVGQSRVLRYRLANLLDMARAGRNGGRWA
ncbi:hypothetical protein TPA0907_03220 [Micromonospora humidisoli]|uniref:hypothetical protein n=1 Tax=Micromonospora sp. AKA109 TaxID=2733865 RepID=UPI0022BBEE3A|nr:hypothetical protein [Micromonospora sp. AKA109]GHJ05955.1 hypothetical protein TPA0907_03220 [Micromonospora sp. AKA109]